MKALYLFFILLLGLSLVSCTRSEDSKQDNVKLSLALGVLSQSNKFQSVSSQAISGTLGHLIINVTGPSIPNPILYQWSAHGPGGSTLTAPASFDLDIPKGDTLIQVLAVFSNSTNNSTSFSYGDVQKVLVNATESVPITVNPLGANLVTGSISGRYLTGTTSGPTGKVEIKYAPPGKPEMILEKGTIVNGWFNLFALSGANLRYVVSDGSVLWGGPVSLDDNLFKPATASTQISRYSNPISKKKNFTGGGNFNWIVESPGIYVVGWFGPSVGSQKVCKPNVTAYNSGYTNRLVEYNLTTTNNTEPSTYFSIQQDFGGATNPPSSASLLSNMGWTHIHYGEASNHSDCTGGTEFTTKLTFSLDQYDGNGNDGAALFFPPFRKANTTSAILIDYYGTTDFYRISGSLLPYLTSMVNKLILFKRVANDNWSSDEKIYSCAAAKAGAEGFVEISTASISSVFSSIQTLSGVEAKGSGSALLVCPGYNSTMFENGILVMGDKLRQFDPCSSGNPTIGTVCPGGVIYAGELNSGTNKYMTTPGGCADIPTALQAGGGTNSKYSLSDFTVTCSGSTDSLTKTWNDGSTNYFDISGLTNYATTMGTGQGASNIDNNFGSINTFNIVAITASGEGGYHAAARYCDKLVYGGYSDWFLPNRYELNLMYDNVGNIPGINTSTNYWSSTEKDLQYSWVQNFSTGYQAVAAKQIGTYFVRCMRRY
jgi:hypothetical protein